MRRRTRTQRKLTKVSPILCEDPVASFPLAAAAVQVWPDPPPESPPRQPTGQARGCWSTLPMPSPGWFWNILVSPLTQASQPGAGFS